MSRSVLGVVTVACCAAGALVIDGSQECDGAMVSTEAFGARLPNGLMVVQDGTDDPEVLTRPRKRATPATSSNVKSWTPATCRRRPDRPDPAMPLRLARPEVLHLVSRGLPNKQIARSLGISESTVKVHLANVFRRIGVQDRISAALWAREHLPPE